MRGIVLSFVIVVMLFASGCSILRPTAGWPGSQVSPPSSDNLTRIVHKTDFFLGLFLVGVVVGAVIGMSGAKFGWLILGGNLIGIFMYLTIAQYGAWMAFFGLLASVAGAIYLVVYNHRFKIQNINGIQDIKKKLVGNLHPIIENVPNDKLQDIVHDTVNHVMRTHQDSLVRNEVLQLKAKLKQKEMDREDKGK